MNTRRIQVFDSGFRILAVCSLAALVFLAGCGSNSSNYGSSGNSGSGSGATGSVRGTASMGAPIVGATVTLKDSTGKSSTATTASDGTYSLDTTGMTPPFFIRVVTSSGTTLYSVSADTLSTTTINTHVLSDLILRSWFTSQGVNPDTAFANPVTNPPPSPLAVQTIAGTVIDVIQLWLNNAGVSVTTGTPSGSQVNLISSTLVANNTGLDSVLHLTSETVNPSNGSVTQIKISNGTTTQTSATSYSGGSITVNTTTSSGGATSFEIVTGVVPNTAQQNALSAINSQLTKFMNTINTKGAALSGSDILPFYASDYLNDGYNGTQDAANFAANAAGATVSNVQVADLKSLDTAKGVADVLISGTITIPNKGTQNSTFEWIFESSGGTWLIGGDKRIAQLTLQQLTWNSEGAQTSDAAFINAGFDAPQSTLQTGSGTGCSQTSPQTITGGGNIWPATPCSATPSATGMILYEGTIGGGAQTQAEFAVVSNSLASLLNAGTVFTYNVAPVSGSAVSYNVPANAGTNESIAITSVTSGSTMTPPSGSLSNYALGQPVTLNWTLPKTFAIADVKYSVTVFDGIPGSGGVNSCGGNGTHVAITATSASTTIPSTDTCTGNPIKAIDLDVQVTGVNGELARATVFIQ